MRNYMFLRNRRIQHLTSVALFASMFSGMVLSAWASECRPGDPCYDARDKLAFAYADGDELANNDGDMIEDKDEHCSGWGNRLAAGAPIWFFQEEGTEVGGGIYGDVYSCCMPINFRVGAEVVHMTADQPAALASAQEAGEDAQLTFVRVPFAVEYMWRFPNDHTTLFAGLGPDIINTANDISDTSVGLHLSARLLHNFNEHWGVAVEAGYMWGEVENDQGSDVDLDNAFIIPTLSYTF